VGASSAVAAGGGADFSRSGQVAVVGGVSVGVVGLLAFLAASDGWSAGLSAAMGPPKSTCRHEMRQIQLDAYVSNRGEPVKCDPGMMSPAFLIPLLGLIVFPYATLFYVLLYSPVAAGGTRTQSPLSPSARYTKINAATSGMTTAAVIGHVPGSTSQIGTESAKTSAKNRTGDRICKR
jgi:hypothetical protein